MDGTLVDAYKAVASSLNHAFSVFGFPSVDDVTIQRSVGWGDKMLVGKFVPPEKIDQVLSVYRTHHTRALRSGTKFLPGTKAVLDALKKDGYTLAIASNRPSRFTHIILKHLIIEGYFTAVVCADQVENPKPAPDMLKAILKRCRLGPQEALYVGDMTIDAQTGQEAGVRTVCVVSGSSTQEEIQKLKPFRIIHQIKDLPGILEELNGKDC